MITKNPPKGISSGVYRFEFLRVLGFLLFSVFGKLTLKVFGVKLFDGFFEFCYNPAHYFNHLFLLANLLFSSLGKLLIVWSAVENARYFFMSGFALGKCAPLGVMPKSNNDFAVQRTVVTSGAQSKRFLDIIGDTYGCSFHDTILLPNWRQRKATA